MVSKSALCAVAALLVTASGASAGTQTINRHGSIFHQVSTSNPYNPDGLTSLLDFKLGDAIDLTITFDDAEIGPLMGGLNHRPNPMLTNPDYTGVALGNGNPANSVTFTVGTHTVGLADFVCATDTDACEAGNQLDFRYGPTAIFYKGQFIGLDSLFGIGGSAFDSPGIGQFVKYALVDDDPTISDELGTPLRTDFVYLQSNGGGNVVFIGKFDTPGISAGVPEPASWASMLVGFGGLGVAMRRRRKAKAHLQYA